MHEASRHEFYHRETNERDGGSDEAVGIARETAGTTDPSECMFDDPALGLNDEAPVCFPPCDDLDGPSAGAAHRPRNAFAAIASITEDDLDEGKSGATDDPKPEPVVDADARFSVRSSGRKRHGPGRVADFERMFRMALSAALRNGCRVEDAEDAVQEAFLRVYKYKQSHELRSREAMLVTVAVNVSIDEQRRKRLAPFDTPQEILEQISDSTPGPQEILLAKARVQHARDGLQQLSEKSRRILLARLNNLSVAAIAEMECITVAAVEKQIARSTVRLTEWMDGW